MELRNRRVRGLHALATASGPVDGLRIGDPSRRRALLALVRSAAAPDRIVLIGTRPPYLLARRLGRQYAKAMVLVITHRSIVGAPSRRFTIAEASSTGAIRRVLEGWGAPDLVICDGAVPSDAPAGQMVQTVLPMLAHGGRLIVPDGPAWARGDEVESDPAVIARLAELGRQLATGRVPDAHPDDLARARCIDAVEDVGGWSVVHRRGHALIKVRDRRADAVLTGRLGPDWGRELQIRPRREFQARSALWVNDPGVPNEFRPRFEVPPRHLRLYREATCTPRQLVVVGDVIAPISFHHPCAKRLNNRQSVDVGPHAAVPELPLEAAPRLRGTYYHLISEFPGHFGHFMTEDLARLWGWDLACAEFDDLRLLLSVRKPGDTVPTYVLDLLQAYGIDREERSSSSIVRRRSSGLSGATPQFHNGRYVDPDIEQTWCPTGRSAGRYRSFDTLADLRRRARQDSRGHATTRRRWRRSSTPGVLTVVQPSRHPIATAGHLVRRRGRGGRLRRLGAVQRDLPASAGTA